VETILFKIKFLLF